MDTQVVADSKYRKTDEQEELKRPKCEYLNCQKPARWVCSWQLNWGRIWKLGCDLHYEKFGGPAYMASRLEGIVSRRDHPNHPIGSPEPEVI